MDDVDIGVIVAKFDRDEEKLARILECLHKHPGGAKYGL